MYRESFYPIFTPWLIHCVHALCDCTYMIDTYQTFYVESILYISKSLKINPVGNSLFEKNVFIKQACGNFPVGAPARYKAVTMGFAWVMVPFLYLRRLSIVFATHG